MDLKDVIVPGGGQNDIWHQLHFKGKYAGEIRVELTYYDTRPKDEAVLEQRREKERGHTNSGGGSAAVGGPRQPGSRNVKRRPLPQGPPGSSPASRPLPDHVHSAPLPALHSSPRNNGPSDHRNIWAPDQHYHSGIDQPVSNYEESFANSHENPSSLGDNHTHASPQAFSHVQETIPSYPADDGFDRMEPGMEPNDHNHHSDCNAVPSSATPHSSYHTPRQNERRHSAQPAFPPQDAIEHSASPPYASSPPVWSTPGMVHSAPGSGDHGRRAQVDRYGSSPIKTDIYRDSPLRQSMSQHDIELDYEPRPDSPDDRLPPPPPAHGHRLPSSRAPSNTYQDANDFQGSRKVQVSPSTNFSPDVRSPLQTIERNFEPYYQPEASVLPPFSAKSDPYEVYSKPGYSPFEPPPRSNTFPRPSSNRENNPPPSAGGYDTIPKETDEVLSYHDAGQQRSWNGPSPSGQPRGLFTHERQTQAYDFPDIPDQQRTYQSQIPLVRPRAISPAVRNAPLRKSIGSQSTLPRDDRRLSGVPFGPDSYDILNPTTSPPVAASTSQAKVETPEQLKEAARLHEVEKPPEQGPIIGNDGREIDPSDHLPSDTWAPEPERKNRKPEVVIRFRTKDDAVRTPIKFGSSPTAARPLSMPMQAKNGSPYSVESPSSGVKVGRNRLQKQMPSRPLPTQPFRHAHSSPLMPVAPPVSEFNTPPPRSQMLPVNDFNNHSSGSRVPMRPAMSEYSVVASRSHGGSPSSNGYEPNPPPIPAKVPFYPAEAPPYRPYGDVDPFTAEMSSIDIGGSGIGGRRGGGRSRRVFEV